jgi:hypothetical protein
MTEDNPMPHDDRLLEVLQRWEEFRAQNRDISPEELCADCPEQLGAVRRAMRTIRRVDTLLDPNEGGDAPGKGTEDPDRTRNEAPAPPPGLSQTPDTSEAPDKSEPALPWEQAARYVGDVADALTEVHAVGLLHRDIKRDAWTAAVVAITHGMA